MTCKGEPKRKGKREEKGQKDTTDFS